jgi:putative membrane protein
MSRFWNPRWATALLVVFYAVGLVGLWIQGPSFVRSTPLILILNGMALVAFASERGPAFWRFLVVVVAGGYAVELLGVRTGRIFGAYHYGEALGWKLSFVPPLIGLNWMVMTLATADVAARFTQNLLGSALLGAAAMVAFDALLEPLAPALDFWYWDEGAAPLQNFVSWFVVAFFFHLLLGNLDIPRRNPMGLPVFLLQIVFFTGVWFILG